MEEKKNNKGLVWLIVILVVLVLGLAGYIVYDKVLSTDKKMNENKTPTTTITNKTEVSTDKTFSKEDLEKYLSYVPFSMRYDDAYIGKAVNLNSIDVSTLMDTAFGNVEKSIIEDIEECKYEGCAKEQILNDKLKESYNMDGFKSNEYLDLTNGYYYVKVLGIGGSKYKSTASNILYEFIGEELIIKEQIGIINEAGGHVDIYNGEDIVKQYSSENLIEDNTNYEEVAEEYVKNNIGTFNTYKHTFKQHQDGTYYWYSTELAN